MTDPHNATSERIKRRAYQLWEQAGRPLGRSDEFWEQAALDVSNEILDTPPPSRSAP